MQYCLLFLNAMISAHNIRTSRKKKNHLWLYSRV